MSLMLLAWKQPLHFKQVQNDTPADFSLYLSEYLLIAILCLQVRTSKFDPKAKGDNKEAQQNLWAARY